MTKTVTYHTPGLIDFRMNLPLNGSYITIIFNPGHISAYRNYWASYSTANSVIRHLIENSPAFLSGKVAVRQ